MTSTLVGCGRPRCWAGRRTVRAAVLGGPQGGSIAVLQPGRELVLRGQPAGMGGLAGCHGARLQPNTCSRRTCSPRLSQRSCQHWPASASGRRGSRGCSGTYAHQPSPSRTAGVGAAWAAGPPAPAPPMRVDQDRQLLPRVWVVDAQGDAAVGAGYARVGDLVHLLCAGPARVASWGRQLVQACAQLRLAWGRRTRGRPCRSRASLPGLWCLQGRERQGRCPCASP